jgi:hypothetical protein
MRTKILIVGLAVLSVLAAAQSQSNETKNKTAGTAPGPASGKLASQGVVHRDLAAREAASGMATGKVATADMNGDGRNDRTAGSGYNVKSQTKARVAAGDVNGDGVADATASNNTGASTKGTGATSNSGVKSPRDASSGMATGKRQHQPLTVSK